MAMGCVQTFEHVRQSPTPDRDWVHDLWFTLGSTLLDNPPVALSLFPSCVGLSAILDLLTHIFVAWIFTPHEETVWDEEIFQAENFRLLCQNENGM